MTDRPGTVDRSGIAPAILVSALIHVGLLQLPATSPRSDGSFTDHSSAVRPTVIQLQLTAQPPSPDESLRRGKPLSAVAEEAAQLPAARGNTASSRGPDINAYLPSEALDQRPQMVEELPVDPPELRQLRQGGLLVMTLLIDETGLVNRALLERSDLPQAFVDVTRQGMSLVRFSPGIKDGLPVKSQLRLEIRYRALEAMASEPPPEGQPLQLPHPPLRPALSAEGN